jgi:hypothetical protein
MRLPAKFDELKVGQQVRVFYNKNDNMAWGITILTEAPAGSSPAATAEK